MSCIYRKRRLLLDVLRGRRRRTANADQCLSADYNSHHCRCRNKRGCGRDAHNGEETSSIKRTRSFHNFLSFSQVVDPAIAGLNDGEKCRERAFLTLPRIQIVTEVVSTKTLSKVSS